MEKSSLLFSNKTQNKFHQARLIDPAHLLGTLEYTFATSSWPFASIVNTDTKDGDYKFSNHTSTKKILKYDPSPKTAE